MITHGFDRRFSFLVLSLHGVERSTYGVIIAFGAIAVSTSVRVMADLILACLSRADRILVWVLN